MTIKFDYKLRIFINLINIYLYIFLIFSFRKTFAYPNIRIMFLIFCTIFYNVGMESYKGWIKSYNDIEMKSYKGWMKSYNNMG